MAYTKEDFEKAPIMESSHYMTLENPIFEGQTHVDENNNYIMYFSNNNQLFGYKHNLYN